MRCHRTDMLEHCLAMPGRPPQAVEGIEQRYAEIALDARETARPTVVSSMRSRALAPA
ncbi:hypothetical protein ACVW0I_005310 [Bradyrhizobium sp. LM6.11]